MLKKYWLKCPMCGKVHDYYILEETKTPSTHCECGYMFCGWDEINIAEEKEPTCNCPTKCDNCKCHQYCDDEETSKEVGYDFQRFVGTLESQIKEEEKCQTKERRTELTEGVAKLLEKILSVVNVYFVEVLILPFIMLYSVDLLRSLITLKAITFQCAVVAKKFIIN